jgi:hypothetical protein
MGRGIATTGEGDGMRKVKPSELEPILAELVESHKISETQAEAVRLHIVEGKTYPEIARIYGISVTAANARCFKGLQRLRKLGFEIGKRRNPNNDEVTIDYSPLIKRYADEMHMTFNEALRFIGTRDNLECSASLLGIEMAFYRDGTTKAQLKALGAYLSTHGYEIDQMYETGVERYVKEMTG